MSSDKLDRHLQDKIYPHQSEVDVDAIWAAVEPKRRKKPFLWWWITGVFLLAGLGAATLWYGTNDTTVYSNAIQTEQNNEPANVNEELTTNSTKTPSTQKMNGANDWKEKNTNNSLNDANNSLSSPTNLSQKQTNKEPLTTANIALENTNLLAKNAIKTPFHQANSNITNQQIETTDLAETAITTTPELAPIKEESLLSQTQTKNADNRNNTLAAVSPITTLSLQLTTTNPTSLLPEVSPIPPSPPKKDWSPWSIQANTGIYHIKKDWEKGDSLGGLWLAIREDSESLLEAASAELSLNYNFSKHLQVRSGLEYLQINSLYKTQYTYTEVDTVPGIQTIFIGPENDSTIVMGPIRQYQTLSRNKETFNSIRQWNIPLLLAYQINRGKWQFFAEGGIRLNISQKAEGEVFDLESTEAVDINDMVAYKNSIGLTYQLGLGAAYQVLPNLDIMLSANTRYAPNNFTESNAHIQEKYQLTGAQLGLRWKF